jgi:6-pyruvoyltetrahydropterin/6-carboxytetrahydropterin synthase
MYKLVKQIHFCYGHRLLDYQGKCAHPHGHNGIVEVKLASSTLDQKGMVVDFSEIKKTIKRYIEDQLDHRMLLRKDDVLVDVLREVGEDPLLMEDNPTAENIAKLIFEHVKQFGFPIISIGLWETHDSYAEYSP